MQTRAVKSHSQILYEPVPPTSSGAGVQSVMGHLLSPLPPILAPYHSSRPSLEVLEPPPSLLPTFQPGRADSRVSAWP